MFERKLDLKSVLNRKSLFLLGPRQTGKSTLLRAAFPGALLIDLLDGARFRALASRPESLSDLVRQHKGSGAGQRIVVVDEVQKLPELLDSVHRLIEQDKGVRFILTGSSARKLRKAGTNLLGGRASRMLMHPIVYPELLSQASPAFSYEKCVQWGGLPHVLNSSDPKQDLKDYIGLYLKEEVQAEGLTRSISSFSRFLETAAATNGDQVIFSAVASDAQVPARTVRDYYQVLEDTLVGTLLPAYRGTAKRKAMASAKFYFFDVGVANALLGRWTLERGTPDFGRAFEHYVFCELSAAIDYLGSDGQLYYWRSLSQLEVDFVIETPGQRAVGIEVKGKEAVSRRDYKGLLALEADLKGMRKIVVCLEPDARRTEEGVEIMPIERFLEALWAKELF